mgnify:CR=1 FL=1
MERLTLLSEEPRASRSASPVSAKDWTELLDSSESISDFYASLCRAGLSGKMCPEPYHLTGAKTSGSFSGSGRNSGILWHGEFLTLNTSECPSDAVVCLLSDILETGEIHSRYFLSQKACQGILRRAEKRGKKLPRLLELCLQMGGGTTRPAGNANELDFCVANERVGHGLLASSNGNIKEPDKQDYVVHPTQDVARCLVTKTRIDYETETFVCHSNAKP